VDAHELPHLGRAVAALEQSLATGEPMPLTRIVPRRLQTNSSFSSSYVVRVIWISPGVLFRTSGWLNAPRGKRVLRAERGCPKPDPHAFLLVFMLTGILGEVLFPDADLPVWLRLKACRSGPIRSPHCSE
jgi:hypothetical protein